VSAVGGVEVDRVAAELAHRHLEGDAGPRRRFFEDHRQCLAGERPIATPVLVGEPGVEHPAQLGGVELVDVEEVARRVGRRVPSVD
jgi:hypothetical protein